MSSKTERVVEGFLSKVNIKDTVKFPEQEIRVSIGKYIFLHEIDKLIIYMKFIINPLYCFNCAFFYAQKSKDLIFSTGNP